MKITPVLVALLPLANASFFTEVLCRFTQPGEPILTERELELRRQISELDEAIRIQEKEKEDIMEEYMSIRRLDNRKDDRRRVAQRELLDTYKEFMEEADRVLEDLKKERTKLASG